MLQVKLTSNMTHQSFDMLLRMNKLHFLPQPNIAPKSWHVVKRVAQLPEPHQHEYHMCSCPSHTVWGPMPKKQWRVYDLNNDDDQLVWNQLEASV